jgi:hypothetical protein
MAGTLTKATKKRHNRAPASGQYTITPEDGRVRPKHIDE